MQSDRSLCVLDFPSQERFLDEIRQGEYDVVGISSIQTNLLKVRRMCRMIRKHLPQASIVIGGHIANIPDLQRWCEFDHVVRGDGVRWMRRFLGDDEDRPLSRSASASQHWLANHGNFAARPPG